MNLKMTPQVRESLLLLHEFMLDSLERELEDSIALAERNPIMFGDWPDNVRSNIAFIMAERDELLALREAA